MTEQERLKQLTEELQKASDSYYNGKEIMSNFEYDAKFDELKALEEQFHITDGFTSKVGAEIVRGNLPKIMHEYPAKSLGKTKDVAEVYRIQAGGIDGEDGFSCLSWKMDGCTLQLTYENGKLKTAATRGNGFIGQDVTQNALYIQGIPQEIAYKGKLVVRGEAVMSYEEFDRINAGLSAEEKYANPRNLTAATITLLHPEELENRKIHFKAFELVDIINEVVNKNEFAFLNTNPRFSNFSQRLNYLCSLGFGVVEYQRVNVKDLKNVIAEWSDEKRIRSIGFPVDGLVIAYDDVQSTRSLPETGHHPHMRKGMAFKWQDELVQSKLLDIEWSIGRTGVITPVAIFEPIEICGTTVSRASLHNLSEMQRILGTPYKNQEIQVYKANMIIPQIQSGIKMEDLSYSVTSQTIAPPNECPCCKKPVIIQNKNNVLNLICESQDCLEKQIGKFAHFVSRDCMNVIGLSEETLRKFVEKGWIREFSDIYTFTYEYRNEILAMDGFGKKSLEKLDDALEKSRHTTFVPFIHALGIPNVGKGQAKLLLPEVEKYIASKALTFEDNLPYGKKLIHGLLDMVRMNYDFTQVDGFGEKIDQSIKEYFAEIVEDCMAYVDNAFYDLLENMIFEDTETSKEKNCTGLAGLTFVVTGDVYYFKNRAELQAKIEEFGGKNAGSVSSKTSYLINNDITSTSGKNKKAKDLGIPIITEEEFLKMISDKEKENTEEIEEEKE